MRIATVVTASQLCLFVFLSLGCLDTASKSNDSGQSIAGTGGAGTAAAGGATAGNAAAGSGGAGMGAAGTTGAAGATAGVPAAGGGGVVAGSGGALAEEDAGVAGQAGQSGGPAAGSGGMEMPAAGSGGMEPPAAGSGGAPATTAPDPSLVMGTGKMCSSYGMPANGKCGGYFCGVDQATLAKAVDPKALCGGDVALLCSNKVISAVGKCARDIKSAMPLASNDQLRPMVQSCVFQDAELQQKVTPECLSCTITAAECAGDNCLLECLAGDSSGCDNCRKQNNCDQPVFTCGGIPSPL